MDGLFFSLTNPKSANSFLLMVGFVLVVVTIYGVIEAIFATLKWCNVPVGKNHRRFIKMTTGLAAGLVALQSIGQLAAHDIAVLLPFTLLVYMYVSYGRGERAHET
jgi:hypothetical protein